MARQERRQGPRQAKTKLQQLRLPGGRTRVSQTAHLAGQLLAETGRFFIRGGSLFELQGDHGDVTLALVKPQTFVSAIEEVANVVVWDNSQRRWVPAIFNTTNAGYVLHASEFIRSIPEIKCLTRCPVLVERAGGLFEVAGYDETTHILAGGSPVEDLTPEKAKTVLRELLRDFRCQSPADRSRALAALLSPALAFGRLLGTSRTPVTVVEADQSQTGKGYFVRVIAAVYGDVPAAVTQRRGGVGGLEEDFDTRIVEGRSFVCLDNLRGRFDSPKLESFLTEDCYSARTQVRVSS
jgi:hypothetical protein